MDRSVAILLECPIGLGQHCPLVFREIIGSGLVLAGNKVG